MNIRKDLIAATMAGTWLIINISVFFMGANSTTDVAISNMACMSVVGIIVLIKQTNTRFANWLEVPLKK